MGDLATLPDICLSCFGRETNVLTLRPLLGSRAEPATLVTPPTLGARAGTGGPRAASAVDRMWQDLLRNTGAMAPLW